MNFKKSVPYEMMISLNSSGVFAKKSGFSFMSASLVLYPHVTAIELIPDFLAASMSLTSSHT